eukprot:TRINITY_DN20190_c0_g1_i1.p1 TRINITY_DN20190_c0_g1~~TRINITY_DN20190_c0_g1_i1.p1  ORF type:complete len:509 (-),score=34.11 TRINITY_DN20190_c0_g1_i1:249-1775(-)
MKEDMKMAPEIMVVPFHGQGHLFPTLELCNHLTSRNYKITLVISANLSSSLSSSTRQNPLIQIAELSTSSPSENFPHHPFPPAHAHLMAEPFAELLSQRYAGSDSPPPICVVFDVMMSWTQEICRKFRIPYISFFTSGACSAAMEHAISKLQQENENLTPGKTVKFPDFPDDMALTPSDLTHRDRPPPPHIRDGERPHNFRWGPPPADHLGGDHSRHPSGRRGPPQWISETEGSIALLMNTCSDLERPFLDYIGKESGKPVWGVGPLLPADFWRSGDSLVQDSQVRSKRDSEVSEQEVREWLDSKRRGSVIFVSFGTEVSPTEDELAELAAGLEESNQHFIWVLQKGPRRHGPPGHENSGGHGSSFTENLVSGVKGRGLVIRGWAPQLMILSHGSTAGFVSHCGWNSTIEALGRGVPLLAWPLRGDQFHNAKLVVSHLKVGYMLPSSEGDSAIRKEDVIRGIEKLMDDDEVRKRAASLPSIFGGGFPVSSTTSLDALGDFISQICHKK